MRDHVFVLILMVGVMSSLMVSSALADVAPPVQVYVSSGAKAAVEGLLYQGTLTVSAARSVQLSDLRLSGEGWNGLRLLDPPSRSLGRGGRLDLRFEGTPVDPDAIFWVELNVDGQSVRTRLDLSATSIRQGFHAQRVAISPNVTSAAPRDAVLPAPEPARGGHWRPSAERGTTPPQEEKPGTRTSGATIQVSGDCKYLRRATFTRTDGTMHQEGDGLLGDLDGATIEVWDENPFPFPDVLLATTITGDDGHFQASFSWDPGGGDSLPDIYVLITLENSHVGVRNPTYNEPYVYATGTTWNYTGTDLQYGAIVPTTQEGRSYWHMMSTAVRSWRWVLVAGQGSTDFVRILSPTGQWPNGGWGTIFMPGNNQDWDESTLAHEYAHNWQSLMAGYLAEFGYCNPGGYCDDDPAVNDCGHCGWCEEDAGGALNEGFANYFGHTVTSEFAINYGVPAVWPGDFEHIHGCIDSQGDACGCDPLITEGFFGAFLWDVDDAPSDDDPYFPGWRDRLIHTPGGILQVFVNTQPGSPLEFIQGYRAAKPQSERLIWETARNNGYQPDDEAPGVVTNLTSTSHLIGSASFDPTIDFTWTEPLDGWSGVGSYSVRVHTAPIQPDAVADIGAVTSYTTTGLAPGDWYLSIRAIDRAGLVSQAWTSFGPITIRAAVPTDLEFTVPAGWAYQVVPRETNNSTSNSVPAPISLVGNGPPTYGNMRGVNIGDYALETFAIGMYVDGVLKLSGAVPPLNPGQQFQALNFGPITVKSGRHTFEGRIDPSDNVVEIDEADNEWARQWVWQPQVLPVAQINTWPAPPDRDAGFPVVEGEAFYNCTGMRFNSSGWWNVFVIHSTDLDADYDARLHAASTGPLDGFTTNIGYGSQGPGQTDAVIVNRNVVTGVRDYDVGVINANDSAATFKTQHVVSADLLANVDVPITLAANEMLAVREHWVSTATLGWKTVIIQSDPADGPIHISWFDRAFTTGDLLDADAIRTTDASGRVTLGEYAGSQGYYGLVFSRNPGDGTDAVTFTVRIEDATPELEPFTPAGWAAPVVPRSVHDIPYPFTAVPAPTELVGNAAQTWFYAAQRNTGFVGSAAFLVAIVQDGTVQNIQYPSPDLTAGAERLWTTGSVHTFPGGRHSVGFVVDDTDAVYEHDEADNVYGEQWVWSPMPLPLETVVSRSAPPPRSGGWELLGEGQTLWYNCDGLRTPLFNISPLPSKWAAVFLMPGEGTDHDLLVHTPGDVKTGFQQSLAASWWGPSQSDFVLINMRKTSARQFDVGVRSNTGTGSADVYTTLSSLVSTAQPVTGPYELTAGRPINLHEVYLNTGDWDLSVINVDGNVDWGMSVHPADQAYLAKSEVLSGGLAWLNPTGADESVTVSIPQAGFYALAVWKSVSSEMATAGHYQLRVATTVTAVPPGGETPERPIISSVVPNPFGMSTTVAFELFGDGPVELAVFDLRGRLVRTLVSGYRPAGQFKSVWDGRDDLGRPVASGTYLLELETGDLRIHGKVTLLK